MEKNYDENNPWQAGIVIEHEGKKEKIDEDDLYKYKKVTIPIPGLTKVMLAEKPICYKLENSQLSLRIGFDLQKDQLTLHYLGVNFETLPKFELTDTIYQNDYRGASTDKTLRVSWFLIYRSNKYEVIARHFKKTKRTELEFEKAKALLKGYNFCDPSAPVLPLQVQGPGSTPWKLALRQDYERRAFALFVNNTAFNDLPLQYSLVPDGP